MNTEKNVTYGVPVFGTVSQEHPVANTAQGQVMGENRDGVGIFRGIPYGDSCDGANRFLPPRKAKAWDGVRDCTKNGYYAVQFATSISGSHDFGLYFSAGKPELFGVQDEKQGENCLVLNVLTPGIDQKKRPVLVYIHGGGYATGSGTTVLGSDKLVREQDIVVVGINHRLNVFGYLYLGAFDEKYAQSGMAGILDLVLALEWVRDNIAEFGGDPDNVTIMGESGGGGKVSTLLSMEKAKGLFHKAIVESGSGAVGSYSREEATAVAEKVLKNLGVGTDELERLADFTDREILEAVRGDGIGELAFRFQPVADGINLDYNEEGVIKAPDISDQIPLLVGASEDEMGCFVPSSVFDVTWDTIREALINPGMFGLRDELVSAISEENVDRILKVFRETDRKNNSADHLYLKIISLSGFLGRGAYYHALAKAKKGCAPVYHYVVAFDSPDLNVKGKHDAWHTADLPLQLRIVLYPECEYLSEIMSNAWGAFIRTGNPSTKELEWPAFTEKGKDVMVFDDICRVEKDPLRELREVLEEK